MRVREDQISRNGAPGIYGVVEKADAVIIAAIQDGQIYLVEQYRYPVGARYWELPQGIHEDGQGDPVEDARAELLQETGLIAESMTEIGQAYQAYGYSNQLVRLFHATGLRQGPQQLEPEEADMITRAFPLQTFRDMILSGQIKDGMTVACLAMLSARSLI
ncbi:MAG: NUDIX hydrolase [Paracoccaceae bacterium]|nr:NUDIX hydrolase [Paracoccaceae bacterium]